jgi:hypothetical protein
MVLVIQGNIDPVIYLLLEICLSVNAGRKSGSNQENEK